MVMAASAVTSCAPTMKAAKTHDIQIVAINDLGNAQTNAHLTQYDTAHGKFPGTVSRSMAITWWSMVTAFAYWPTATRQNCRGVSWALTSCWNAPAFFTN